MINLNKYVEERSMALPIENRCSMVDFTRFLVTNNWLGLTPEIKDDEIYVPKSKFERVKPVIDNFINYNGSPDKIEMLYEMLSKQLPKTGELFMKYCTECNLNEQTAYVLIDFLNYYLPGEITFCTDKEVTELMEEAYSTLPKVYGSLLSDFINWVQSNNKVSYYKKYFMDGKRYSESDAGAYDPDYYLKILYHFFSPKYIEDNNMYALAASSKNYVDTWLFISLHFVSAIRNPDLLRLPHPRLPMEPEKVLEQVFEGNFSDDDAVATLQSVIFTMRALSMTPNKTASVANVPALKLEIPVSAEVHMGTLFAVAEAHHQINKLGKDKPLIRIITSYQMINSYMGEEIGDLFLASDFKGKAANKSYMQLIYMLTDQICDSDNEFNVKGYLLAAIARSHKGSYGEFAQSTSVYLKDAKMGGYTAEFVARELFERGVLSFIPSTLLNIVTDGKYGKMSPENQTRMIAELNMKKSDIENCVELMNITLKQGNELAVSIYENHSREEVLRILHRLGNGNALSKDEESLCLHVATGKLCPFRDRSCCIGCEYEISTKSTMYSIVSDYCRLAKTIKETDSEFEKDRCKAIVHDVILPSMQQLLICAEELYGTETANGLKNIIREVKADG